jgi:SNF2 family DNA or RNA helicase
VAEAQPALRDHIKLFPHQAKAVAHALHSEKTQFKGFILGDHPGLGKTLVMVMTFLLGRQPGDGPAVVVVPGSCQRQWIELMKSQFKPVW